MYVLLFQFDVCWWQCVSLLLLFAIRWLQLELRIEHYLKGYAMGSITFIHLVSFSDCQHSSTCSYRVFRYMRPIIRSNVMPHFLNIIIIHFYFNRVLAFSQRLFSGCFPYKVTMKRQSPIKESITEGGL